MSRKVLIVGIDGATWKILDPLIKKGELPFLAKLVDKNTAGTLKSTIPSNTSTAWTTFQTGVNPGKHGILGFLKYSNDLINPDVYDSNDVHAKVLWDYLGLWGLKSLIINMPMTYPVKIIKGVLVSSFLTPKGKKYVSDKKAEKILKKLNYVIDYTEADVIKGTKVANITKLETDKVIKEIIDISKKRSKALIELSKLDDYSLFFILFKESDLVQHLFFDGDETKKYYKFLDKLLESIFQKFQKRYGDNLSSLIVSDHGFDSSGKYQFSPYQWLKNEDYIKTESGYHANIWQVLSYVNKYLKLLGIGVSSHSYIQKRKEKLVDDAEYDEISRIVEVHGMRVTFEGIYTNEKFHLNLNEVEKLISKLRRLKFQKHKVFDWVGRSKSIYKGRYTNEIPEILWVLNKDVSLNVSALSKEVFSEFESQLKGSHSSDPFGIFVVDGKIFKKKKNVKLDIKDILPLTCLLLGIPIPNNLEGEVPMGIIRDNIKNITYKDKVKLMIKKEILDQNK